jgi:hypothetical protein
MARAVRRSVKTKSRVKPTRRARRVPVAKEKSRPRGRASAKVARTPAKADKSDFSPATLGAPEPTPVKVPRAETAPGAGKAARSLKSAPKEPEAEASSAASDRRKTPTAERRKTTQATRPAAAARGSRKAAPPREAAAPDDDDANAASAASAAPALTDEEQIESAKYQPRRVPPRVFEEERFLFPQSYGVNRLRLLVKDPEWLFAYWDVDPRSLEELRSELGSRAQALSQLTLRVFEDRTGGASTFLLPQDARTWYVPVRTTGRAYRAEVGVILPTGEFRPLARSNAAVAPRVGRSAQKARKRVRYDRVRSPIAPGAAAIGAGEEIPGGDDAWEGPLDAGIGPEEEKRPSARSRGGSAGERGGASDLHRR